MYQDKFGFLPLYSFANLGHNSLFKKEKESLDEQERNPGSRLF